MLTIPGAGGGAEDGTGRRGVSPGRAPVKWGEKTLTLGSRLQSRERRRRAKRQREGVGTAWLPGGGLVEEGMVV